MAAPAQWFQTKTAPTPEALAAGDGCHEDEAQALQEYLDGRMTGPEAARRITAPLLSENEPPTQLYRLWGLLCEALVELPPGFREKLLELLTAIRSLPSAAQIAWADLPGFRHMWYDLYDLHLDGSAPWEKEDLSEARRSELRQSFATVGAVAAEMYRRDLGGMSEHLGYQVLNLVGSGRAGLDLLMAEIHAWVKVAGQQLKKDLTRDEVGSYSRGVLVGRKGEQKAVSATMGEHWEFWKAKLVELSGDQSPLSKEGRQMAKECYEGLV